MASSATSQKKPLTPLTQLFLALHSSEKPLLSHIRDSSTSAQPTEKRQYVPGYAPPSANTFWPVM